MKAKAKARPAAAILAQKRLQAVREAQQKQEEELKRQQEEEERRLREIEEAKQREEAERERKRLLKAEKKERLKKEGKLLTAAEKEKQRKAAIARQLMIDQGLIQAAPELLANASTTDVAGKKERSLVVDVRKKKRKPKLAEEATPVQPNTPLDGSNEPEPEPESETVPEAQKLAQEIDEASDWEAAAEKLLTSSTPAAVQENKATTSKLRTKKPKNTNKKQSSSSAESDSNSGDESSGDESSAAGSKEGTHSTKKTDVPASSELKVTPVTKTSKTKKKMPDQVAELRSPICCILGHVDTGKTKLLDKIRRSNVQGGEAGGITQQIGATFFPYDALWEQCEKVDPTFDMRVPGLLIIDTPGHESFNNLRARGSSLCDIAILVVDLMHGLEPQTKESLGLLRARKCPFVVALNKMDRLYGWAACEWAPAQTTLSKQAESTVEEFDSRLASTLLQLTEEGLNVNVWWKVDDVRKVVCVAPTSAITGEGIPDLLYLLVKLTQTVITRALEFSEEFQCTILEVKNIEGLGTTIDVVLVSGTLFENDKIIVCGMSGPIVTTIRALLTPQPMKELRVKGEYIHHKEIKAAMGVKISAQGLEDAVAGTSLLVARNKTDEEIEDMMDDVMADMSSIFQSVDRSGEGVYVMASTLGSLEALLQFLKDSNIPVFAVNIGTVHKLDIKKASVMREKGRPELCCILAFDVKVDPEAVKEAQLLGVKLFTADIIYHLFDAFTAHTAEEAEAKKREKQAQVVFPAILSIVPNCVFNKKDPIVLGVRVEEGFLKIGTPLCIPEKENLLIGRVASLEHNKKPVERGNKGDELAIKITGDPSIMVGRHFEQSNKLCSRMTREAIDCLKEYFRDDLSKDDWRTVVKIKKLIGLP